MRIGDSNDRWSCCPYFIFYYLLRPCFLDVSINISLLRSRLSNMFLFSPFFQPVIPSFSLPLSPPLIPQSSSPHLILRSFGVLRLAKAKMREDKHQHVATQASVLSTCVRGIRSELSFLLDPALVLARSHAINKEVSGTRSL